MRMGMKKDFVKVDLHIHTPASKCYKGKKNDDEYLKILHEAKKKELKVIAITDHNSIAGYKRIIELRAELLSAKSKYEKITDSDQVAKKILQIKKKLNCFDNILILPGIEYEANPGVHLLVIFSDTTSVSEIENFLMLGGYSGENCGLEIPASLANWDILKLYSEASKYDCLVIDAHTDSDKGMLNVLQKGKYRSECFSSVFLNGVCYNSEKQKEQLAETIKSSKEYRRIHPLAFLKSSDAHMIKDIGKYYSWIKMPDLTFMSLKNAFTNPTESISVEYPDIKVILDLLIKNEITLGVQDFSDGNKDLTIRRISALNNTAGGYILFGMNDMKNKIGLPYDKDIKSNGFIKTIVAWISELDNPIYPLFSLYPLNQQKIIISLFIPPTNNLIGSKTEKVVYQFRNNQLVALTPKEVQKYIEERNTKNIQRKIQKSLIIIDNEKTKINNYFFALEMLKSYEENSVPVSTLVMYTNIESLKLPKLIREKLKDSPSNGRYSGDICYFESKMPPRLDFAYLRYSVPVFPFKGLEKKYKRKRKECTYLVNGGGVFYSNYLFPHYSKVKEDVIYITSKNEKDYSNKFICAFLKSSLNLWFCVNNFEEINFYKKDIFMKLRFPIVKATNQNLIKKIEDNFDKILTYENEFLKKVYKLKDDNDRIDLIMQHNQRVDTPAYEIDKYFYNIMKYDDNQVKILEASLKANGIYLPQL
jgi:hypothetical protein